MNLSPCYTATLLLHTAEYNANKVRVRKCVRVRGCLLVRVRACCAPAGSAKHPRAVSWLPVGCPAAKWVCGFRFYVATAVFYTTTVPLQPRSRHVPIRKFVPLTADCGGSHGQNLFGFVCAVPSSSEEASWPIKKILISGVPRRVLI